MAATDTAVETAEKAATRGLALIMTEVEGGKPFPDERGLHARHGAAMVDVQEAAARGLVARVDCSVPNAEGKIVKRAIRLRPTLAGYRATDTDAAQEVLREADSLIAVLQGIGFGAVFGDGTENGAAAVQLAEHCKLAPHRIGSALSVLSDFGSAFDRGGVDPSTGFVWTLTVSSSIHTLSATAASAPPVSAAEPAYTMPPEPLVVDVMPMMEDGGPESAAAIVIHPRAVYAATGLMPLKEVYEEACERGLVPRSFQGASIQRSGKTQTFRTFTAAVRKAASGGAHGDPIHRLVAVLKRRGNGRRPPRGLATLCLHILAGAAIPVGLDESSLSEAQALVEAAKE